MNYRVPRRRRERKTNEKEKKKKQYEKILEDILVENFPNME